MMKRLGYGAIAVALLASAGVAAAQTSPSPSSPMSPPSATTGRSSQATPLQLSAKQKTEIFQTVTKEKVKSPPPANMAI